MQVPHNLFNRNAVRPTSRTAFAAPAITWGLVAALGSLLIILPIIALIYMALDGGNESMGHILHFVLPRSGPVTLILLVELGVLAAIAGFFSAWLIEFFEFPGRRHFSWLMMLPLAIPTYLAAYGFVEFFSYTGPLQLIIRYLGGYQTARDYWFPDIRNVTGTAIILSLVLYPYIYLTVRSSFRLQGARLMEAARMAGVPPLGILLKITIPLARPAIILGVSLALMEAINDIGAMEYMGVETLTFSVFSTWLNQSNIQGAAQLSLLLLLVVVGLILIERWARRGRKFYEARSTHINLYTARKPLSGWKGWAASLFCAMPVLAGFGIPFYTMADYALIGLSYELDPALITATMTSISYAFIAALVTVIVALCLVYALQQNPHSRILAILVRLSAVGYAVPGTIISLGIFIPFAAFDNWLSDQTSHYLGFSTGLLITGSGATMVFAYVVRFMAMGEGAIDNGMKKISPNIELASRNLGRGQMATLFKTLLPILKPAIMTGFLLVFIDSIKELSATITLRPFGVNTLATYIYDYASRAQVEDAGLAAILVILAGMVPVILIVKTTLDR